MSTAYNSKIVTDGLVLCLDAANPKSYPGTGNTWFDLSGYENHATLYNSPIFSGKVFSFNGIDSYASIPTIDFSTGLSPHTILAATRYSGPIRNTMLSGNLNNWYLGNLNDSTENYYANGWVSDMFSGSSDTLWRIYIATGTTGNLLNNTWELYVNGILKFSNDQAGFEGPNGISIGRWGFGEDLYSTGECSFISAYNRVLSASEIQQNFQALRGRYGV